MARGSFHTTHFRALSKKHVTTLHGKVVYGREKHGMLARDLVRMAKKVEFELTISEIRAWYELTRIAIYRTAVDMPMEAWEKVQPILEIIGSLLSELPEPENGVKIVDRPRGEVMSEQDVMDNILATGMPFSV